MTQAEKSLLERWVVHRDPDAFARIVSEHSAMVYHTCLRLLRSSVEAEDMVQECFLTLASGGARVRASLAGWLHTLATHRSLDRLRAAKRRRDRECRYAETCSQSASVSWDDIQEYVDEAIALLPQKFHDALVAHFLEGQTYDAMAVELGLPRSTVASRVQTAVERVREALRQRGVPVPPSTLGCMLAAQARQPVPSGLSYALAKVAIAGAGGGSGAALASAKTLVTGGSILMAKKAVVGIAMGLVLAFLGFWYVDRLQDAGQNHRAGTSVALETPLDGEIDTGFTESTARKPAAAGSSSDGPAKTDKLSPKPADSVPDQGSASAADKADSQSTVEGSSKKPAASISGYVLDDKGYVFPDASIRVEVTEDAKGSHVLEVFDTKTDTNGLYGISPIGVFGHATVYASAKGYLMQKRYALRLTPGTALDDVDFTLVPGKFFVAGIVEDQDGRPIDGAAVLLRRYHNVNSILSLAYAVSEKDGRFEIAVEREGSCDFSVVKEGYGAGFFPNVNTGTDDARFVLRGPGAIAGQVSLPDGTPVPGARIEVVGEASAMGEAPSDAGFPIQLLPVTTVTDEQGEYLANGLGEGYLYTVRLKRAGDERATGIDEHAPEIFQAAEGILGSASLGQYRAVRVAANETTPGIDFTVQPVARVYGLVTDTSTGAPAYHVTLMGYLGEATKSDSAAWTWTKSDGSYTLNIPMTTQSSVRIAGVYISSLGVGWPASDQPLATMEMAPGAVVQRDLSIDAPCTVPVLVTDGVGAPIAGVALRVNDSGGQGSSGGGGLDVTDAHGRYAVYGIPPNRTFNITVVSSAYGELFTTLAESEPLTGAPGQTLPEVRIAVVSEGGIEGLVLDPSGVPLPDLPITIAAVGGRPVPAADATTDGAGRFTVLRAFPAGTYTEITATADERGFVEQATIPNVTIIAENIIDLGPVALAPVGHNPGAEPQE